ncbi:MAG: exodeoxyribonuclease V subunit gamma, partial [Planctomycetota bacterium]
MGDGRLDIVTAPDLDALLPLLQNALAAECVMAGDPFHAPTVLVPSAPVRQCARLALARDGDDTAAAVHLDLAYLEEGLWRLLADQASVTTNASNADAPDAPDTDRQPLRRETVQTLLLAHLAGPGLDAPALAPVRDYLAAGADGRTQRLWSVTDLLSRLVRDYETHAPDLLQGWLDGTAAEADPVAAAEAHLVRAIFGPDGLRDRADRVAAEAEARPVRSLTLRELLAEADAAPSATPSNTPLHVFGLSALAPLHRRALEHLARSRPVLVYWRDPGALRPPGTREAADEADPLPLWRPPATHPPAGADRLPAPRWDAPASGTLAALQAALLRGESPARIPSAPCPAVHLVAAPDLYREVEAARDRIVELLAADPTLRPDDVLVLVTDMAAYRPAIETVFDRPPFRFRCSIGDIPGTAGARYAEGIADLLALAEDGLTRQGVFRLVRNPCFLGGRLADDEADAWLAWADALGMVRGWDADEKHRGLRLPPGEATDAHTWRQGLARLRLGRVLPADSDFDEDAAAPAYRGRPPYADARSGEDDAVGRFSVTIERLHRLLARAGAARTGTDWAEALAALADAMLAPPDDAPADAAARDQFRAALDELRLYDVANERTVPLSGRLV